MANSATQNEINKAYRKLSLAVHPDKNPEPTARKLFTLLTSIQAILKDPQHREIYDGHLRRGMPKWRGTGYYYNRYKPGPIFILSTVFVTGSFVQYITLWVSYYLKKQDTNEAKQAVNNLTYTQVKKQLKKQGTKIDKKTFKSSSNTDLLNAGEELQKPSVRDVFLVTLPVRLYKAFVKKEPLVQEMKRDESNESIENLMDNSLFERNSMKAKRRQKVNDAFDEVTDW